MAMAQNNAQNVPCVHLSHPPTPAPSTQVKLYARSRNSLKNMIVFLEEENYHPLKKKAN